MGSELDAAVRLEEPCEEYSERSQERDLAERAYGSIEGGAILRGALDGGGWGFGFGRAHGDGMGVLVRGISGVTD